MGREGMQMGRSGKERAGWGDRGGAEFKGELRGREGRDRIFKF